MTAPQLVSDERTFDGLPGPTRRYPVLVTYTEHHLVWVDADTAAEAAESAQYDTHEMVNSQTSYNSDLDVQSPSGSDWRFNSALAGDSFGPWRPGEPSSYVWRQWKPESVARVEARMNAASEADPKCRDCQGSGTVYPGATRDGVPCPTCRPDQGATTS